MVKIILESPYAGDIKRNIDYARACMLDSLKRGEAPLVSHLLYTQVLDDTVKQERDLGIEAGLVWADSADLHVFYIDHGYSAGMLIAKNKAERTGIKTEERKIYK